MSRGKEDRAEKSLKLFRGATKNDTYRPDITSELNELMIQVASDRVKRNNTNAFHVLTQSEVFKPLLLMIILFAFQQFSGIFVVIVYASKFAIESNVSIDSFLATVLIGLARVVATICVAFIMDRFGRRPPLIVSGIGMSLCMFSLALYNGFGLKEYGWIPGLMLLLYIFTSTIGFLSVPFAMMAEIFPRKARGLASGLTVSSCYFMSFIAIKLYPTMVDYLSNVIIFSIYGVMSLFGVVFVHFFLLETKGKTLEEIEEHFKSNKSEQESQVFGISK